CEPPFRRLFHHKNDFGCHLASAPSRLLYHNRVGVPGTCSGKHSTLVEPPGDAGRVETASWSAVSKRACGALLDRRKGVFIPWQRGTIQKANV
ncbi:MAG: hypothetical protein ACUVSM_13390, partial [Armatimonadota bacterium]